MRPGNCSAFLTFHVRSCSDNFQMRAYSAISLPDTLPTRLHVCLHTALPIGLRAGMLAFLRAHLRAGLHRPLQTVNAQQPLNRAVMCLADFFAAQRKLARIDALVASTI